MTARRAIAGVALLVIAVIIIIVGYSNLPDAQTCSNINAITPGACRSAPGAGTYIWAAVTGGLGLLTLAPWAIKWITGR